MYSGKDYCSSASSVRDFPSVGDELRLCRSSFKRRELSCATQLIKRVRCSVVRHCITALFLRFYIFVGCRSRSSCATQRLIKRVRCSVVRHCITALFLRFYIFVGCRSRLGPFIMASFVNTVMLRREGYEVLEVAVDQVTPITVANAFNVSYLCKGNVYHA